MTLKTDLLPKINNEDYQRLILKHSAEFSGGETRLLNEILENSISTLFRHRHWRRR